jgi:hypothetical protein
VRGVSVGQGCTCAAGGLAGREVSARCFAARVSLQSARVCSMEQSVSRPFRAHVFACSWEAGARVASSTDIPSSCK